MKHLKFFFALVVSMMGSGYSYAENFTVESAEGKAIEYTTEYSSSVIVAASSSINQAIVGDLTIPDAVEYNGKQYNVTKIGSQAFKGNTKLTSVTIGNNVTIINESAFYGCTQLAAVTLGTSLARVDKFGFYECTSLRNVVFPNSLQFIGQAAFYGSGLTCDLVFPLSLLTLEVQAFAWTDITSVKFLSNVTIKAGAFNQCSKIAAYYFSPTVLQPTMNYDYSYGSTITINASTKIYVSQATLSMLENNWFQSGHTLQSNYNSLPSAFVAYESTEGSVFMNQIDMANGEGTSVGTLALCFTVTSTDQDNPTAALYCPPSTGYSAADILKSGSNTVIKNALTGDGKLVIPETVTDQSGKSYTVTVIGAGAFGEYATNYYTHITSLKIPSTITHIGVKAFRYLQYLSGNLMIPASVRQIGHPNVARAELFYQDNYGELKVPGIYMMHTSATGIDWYETQANWYLAYNNSGTMTALYVCQEIYDKAYGKNGATRYPTTSAFRSWLLGGWNGSGQVKLFDPATLGLAWSTAQTIVDISGEYEAPELENPFGLSVTYSSSNPNVAAIDEDGNITLGTAEGSTTLTATFAGNEEYTNTVNVQTTIIRRGEPMLAENQENQNVYNTCEALTKVTRWTPNTELYSEENMWNMPHMMDGNFYVSAFWQSNNDSEMSEWFRYNYITYNEKYLQLSCSPAYLSPNYGLDYVAYINHDEQPGTTLGGFICFKVQGSGTIVVRGFTEADNAYMGICVQGNTPLRFSGTEDREVEYTYTLETEDDEAYAYVYGVSLSPNERHGYIRYIKFIPDGTVMADVSVGGVAIEEESDDVLGDGGSVGFEWREDEEGGEENDGGEVKRYVDYANTEGEEGDGDTPVGSTRYPVLILNNANLTSENGPAIEVNSHDHFLIELRGQNTIQASIGNAAISMGTLQSEDWGGGTISIVGLEEGASLTIPSVQGVESGIYLAESSIKVENFAGDINGTDYGVRFQGYDTQDYENDANCNMSFGKGVSLKMRGGEAALSGFNPQSMDNLGCYDEENDEWIEYVLLESDLEYAEPVWSGESGGVYGTQEWVEGVENPDDPEGGSYGYNLTIPAKYLYFGIRPETIPISINSFGMMTFCSSLPLNFTDVEGLKAYIASDFDAETNELTLTRIYEVPERTGLVVYGTEGTFDVPVDESYKYYEPFTNMLVGCTVDTYIQPIDEDYTNFVLSKQPEDNFLGFYRFTTSNPNGRKIEAGKAYLQIETEQVNASDDIKGFTITFDDDPTVIASPRGETKEETAIFDLTGRRLTRLVKGVNIVGGKKIIVK